MFVQVIYLVHVIGHIPCIDSFAIILNRPVQLHVLHILLDVYILRWSLFRFVQVETSECNITQATL